MDDSMPDVYEPLSDFLENYSVSPEITAWPQCFKSQYTQSSHFCNVYRQSSPDQTDQACTGTWEIPVNGLPQNINTQWPTLTRGHFPSRESPAPDEFTVPHRNEICKDNLIAPALTVPIIPRISLMARTEFNHNKPYRVDYLPKQFESNPHYETTVPLYPNLLSPELNSFVESTSGLLSQIVSQRSSQECYDLWKKIRVDAVIAMGSDRFVPQTLYRPLTATDKKRYLELVHLSPPIVFLTKEPLEWGIPLEDVRSGKMQHLVDKNDPVLQNCGPSVSIRINWPGYPPFRYHIPSRNWRRVKGPITRERLARSLARVTARFIDEMSHKPLEADADGIWRVGIQHIRVEDLILVSLHHVSKGSWQPQFRLRGNL